ncbi:MAG: tyrosine-type recombinase/integrase [Proteobacteria bacterium]|nr:tyrosine-type recombinase/integrase [Pseudomonadota bacterium]
MVARSINYNLEQRREGWYVVVDVPPSLRATIGRKRLRETTGARDIRTARLRRDAILARLRAKLEAARRGAGAGVPQSLTATALEVRTELEAARDPEREQQVEDEALSMAEEVEASEGFTAAKSFYDVATGKATPLSVYFGDWLREKAFGERQTADFRTHLQRLATWLTAERLPETLEAVTDKVAAGFKAKALLGAGLHHKTANKIMSSLRSYWRWLEQQGHASRNPWLGKSIAKRDTPEDEKARPFTDDEVRALLYSKEADATLQDVMLIGALSGMRIDEIFQLKVRHCGGGVFKVAHGTGGKTKAAVRDVPVHSRLKATVARLCKGRAQDAYLIEEGSSGWGRGEGKGRSMAASKRFKTYREGLGVDEKLPGKRTSRVTFHSFRRWFITKADRAGMRKEDIERVVGHKVQGMSLGHYSGGATFEQFRKVVESVKLPKK